MESWMVAVWTSILLTMVDARISIPELTDVWFLYFLASICPQNPARRNASLEKIFDFDDLGTRRRDGMIWRPSKVKLVGVD